MGLVGLLSTKTASNCYWTEFGLWVIFSLRRYCIAMMVEVLGFVFYDVSLEQESVCVSEGGGEIS